MDYELNRKYLGIADHNGKTKKIVWGISLLIIGIVFMIICVATMLYSFAAMVITCFIIGVVLLANPNSYNMKITDEQYDNNVMSNVFDIKGQAVIALGIDETEVQEVAPIQFEGYAYKNATKIRQGRDNKFRTNKYHSVIIFFSANEVHVYKYTFDTTEKNSTEETEVYFYKDIVSISTAYDTIEVLGKKIEYEFFNLTTSGGSALTVSVFDSEKAQQSINAMRALLREKKVV